jgi:hypothetical protein
MKNEPQITRIGTDGLKQQMQLRLFICDIRVIRG